MVGFSIIMCFCSIITIILSISLLKGNYASVHGRTFDNTEDKAGYAKALGKPILLLGISFAVVSIVAGVTQSVIVSVIFLLLFIIISYIWFVKIQKRFCSM